MFLLYVIFTFIYMYIVQGLKHAYTYLSNITIAKVRVFMAGCLTSYFPPPHLKILISSSFGRTRLASSELWLSARDLFKRTVSFSSAESTSGRETLIWLSIIFLMNSFLSEELTLAEYPVIFLLIITRSLVNKMERLRVNFFIENPSAICFNKWILCVLFHIMLSSMYCKWFQ